MAGAEETGDGLGEWLGDGLSDGKNEGEGEDERLGDGLDDKDGVGDGDGLTPGTDGEILGVVVSISVALGHGSGSAPGIDGEMSDVDDWFFADWLARPTKTDFGLSTKDGAGPTFAR